MIQCQSAFCCAKLSRTYGAFCRGQTGVLLYMRLIGFLFLVSIAASARTNSRVQTFGTVGIAAGQTARLNVLDVGGQGQAAECIVSMLFLDDQGAVLKTNTFAVLPGRSVSLDLVADMDLGLGTNEQRRPIHPVLAQIPAVVQPQTAPACVLAPTLEIFDQFTGRTSILMVKTTPIPQPLAPATQP